MARSRQLKPDFFLNEDLAMLPALTRLAFQGLWLLADRDGRLEDRPARIKAQLFPYHDADMPAILDSLSPMWITRYIVDKSVDNFTQPRFIQIVNFAKHQHIHPDEKQSVIPPPPTIPGDPRRSPAITPCSSSPSSSPSPSPKQPGQGPIDICEKVDKSVDNYLKNDFSDYRLPLGFGGLQFSRAYLSNISVADCEHLLRLSPGPKVKAALNWRINIVRAEMHQQLRTA